jgi:uncharacterized protein (DUF1697 family)
LPTYVALLRGINVGGARKVPMSDLRELFGSLGHSKVRTYIQSGNVVFTAKSSPPSRIRAALERSVEKSFGFEVTVLLRTPAELGAVAKRNPYGADAYVTFLEAPADAKKVKAIDPAPYRPDEFKVQGTEVYLHCPNGYGNTKINNTFFERKLATRATTRNWKTVSTLLEWANG